MNKTRTRSIVAWLAAIFVYVIFIVALAIFVEDKVMYYRIQAILYGGILLNIFAKQIGKWID